MLKKRNIFKAFVVSFVLLLLVACSNEDVQQNSADVNENETIKMDFGHVLTEDSSYHVIAESFKELVENDHFEVDIFPSSQLGSNDTMIDALIEGDQALVATDLSAIENMLPELAALSFPYVFEDNDEGLNLLNGELGDEINELLKEKGLLSLGWMVVERNVYSTSPINNLEDMSSLKLRVVPAPSYIKSFEAVGAHPTTMDYSEVYVGLQQNSIDGGDAALEQYMQDKFYEVATYYNFTKVHQMPTALIMSKKIFDGLPEDQQEIILSAGKEAMENGVDFYNKQNEEMLLTAEEEGVEFIYPDIDQFIEATESIVDELTKDNEAAKDLYEKINEMKQSN